MAAAVALGQVGGGGADVPECDAPSGAAAGEGVLAGEELGGKISDASRRDRDNVYCGMRHGVLQAVVSGERQG